MSPRRLGDTYTPGGESDAARDRWQEALTILTGLDHPDAAQSDGQ